MVEQTLQCSSHRHKILTILSYHMPMVLPYIDNEEVVTNQWYHLCDDVVL